MMARFGGEGGTPVTWRADYCSISWRRCRPAARSREAKWFKLVGVPLGNGTDLYPSGDDAQTVEPWTPPDMWDGLNSALLNRILDQIEAGLPNGSRYSSAPKAEGRAAWRVVVEHAPDKTERQARDVIKAWLKTGLLLVEDYEDPNRREKLKGLRVNAAKRPS